MRRFFSCVITASFLLLVVIPAKSSAAATVPPTPKGLVISPISQEIKTDAGSPKTATFVVGNLTKQKLTINFSMSEFTVTDNNYNYIFQTPQHDWIKLGYTQLVLSPSESKTIPFTLSSSPNATPGGYYYTLYASSTIQSGSLPSTVQAASLLYVTIKGDLTYNSVLKHSTVQHFVYGNSVGYSTTALDTGNVYYSIYSISHLQGLFTHTSGPTRAHLLIPLKPRLFTGSIPAPILPGIYKVVVGYRTDSGNTLTANHLVVFIPPWSVAALIGIVILTIKLRRLHRRKTKKHASAK